MTHDRAEAGRANCEIDLTYEVRQNLRYLGDSGLIKRKEARHMKRFTIPRVAHCDDGCLARPEQDLKLLSAVEASQARGSRSD